MLESITKHYCGIQNEFFHKKQVENSSPVKQVIPIPNLQTGHHDANGWYSVYLMNKEVSTWNNTLWIFPCIISPVATPRQMIS